MTDLTDVVALTPIHTLAGARALLLGSGKIEPRSPPRHLKTASSPIGASAPSGGWEPSRRCSRRAARRPNSRLPWWETSTASAGGRGWRAWGVSGTSGGGPSSPSWGPHEKNLRRHRRGCRRCLLRDPRAGDEPGRFPAISRSRRPITPVEAEQDISLQQPLDLRSLLLLICPHPTRENRAYGVCREQGNTPGSVFALRTITRSLETRARLNFFFNKMHVV